MTHDDILAKLVGDGRYAYQVEPAKALADALETYGAALNACGMGVGKTSTSLAAALLAGLRPAVICPNSCMPGWKRMFEHFGVEPLFIGSYDAMRAGGTKWYWRGKWDIPSDAVIIWDEAQAMRAGNGSLQGEMLTKAAAQGVKGILVSATIAENPIEMEGSGAMLGLHNGTRDGFEAWIRSFGCFYDEDYERWKFPFQQRWRLREIERHLFGGLIPRGVRVTVQDIGDAFPSSDIQCVEVELPDECRERIESAWARCREVCAKLERQGATKLVVVRQKQAAWHEAYEISQNSKIPFLVDEVRRLIGDGFSVPLFTNYSSTRKSVMAALRTKCGIYGGQGLDAREKHRMDFQQDRSRVIVAQIQSGGTGLDLHDVESEFRRYSLILPCPKWMQIEQATGRVWRAGAGPSVQRILYAAGTVEERMCHRMQEKVANMKAMLDKSEENLVLDADEEPALPTTESAGPTHIESPK